MIIFVLLKCVLMLCFIDRLSIFGNLGYLKVKINWVILKILLKEEIIYFF